MAPEERRVLERIRRAHWQFWLVLALWLPAAWAIVRHPAAVPMLAPITTLWGIAVIVTAIRVARSRCPRCNRYFHSKTDAPSWRPLITPSSRCANCGLALRPERVIYPSLE